MSVLHITNGDAAAAALRHAGVPDEILGWRDVLHEGPVLPGLHLEGLSAVRAAFIARQRWEDATAARESFQTRDATLRRACEYDEVTLWFEHDLYDQLQLLQLLDWFASAGNGARVSLVQTSTYLTALPPDDLRDALVARRPVTGGQRRLGRAAWEAFRAPDPTVLLDLLEQDTSALPHAAAALRRLLAQYPGVRDGLSRTERALLGAVRDGEPSLAAAFQAQARQEEAVFLGDQVFATYLENLSARAAVPLVAGEDGQPLAAPDGNGDTSAFWRTRPLLTEVGRAVLEGEADHVRINGLDRWVGGVHFIGSGVPWRWDAGRGAVVPGSG